MDATGRLFLSLTVCELQSSGWRTTRKESDFATDNYYQDPSFLTMEFDIQRDMVGAVIGKGGSTARNIRLRTGANVHVHSPQNENARAFVELRGRREQIESAFEELRSVVAAVDEEYAKGMQATVTLKTKPESVGCLIGKQGQNIKQIEEETRARVRVEPHEEGEEFQSVHVSGDVAAVEIATRMVQDSLDRYDATRNKKPSYPSRATGMSQIPQTQLDIKPAVPMPEVPAPPESETIGPPIYIQAPTGGLGAHPSILVLHADGTYHPAQIVTPMDGSFAAAGLVAIAPPPSLAAANYIPHTQAFDGNLQRTQQTVYSQQSLQPAPAYMQQIHTIPVTHPPAPTAINYSHVPQQLYSLTASMPAANMNSAIGMTALGMESRSAATMGHTLNMAPSINYPPSTT